MQWHYCWIKGERGKKAEVFLILVDERSKIRVLGLNSKCFMACFLLASAKILDKPRIQKDCWLLNAAEDSEWGSEGFHLHFLETLYSTSSILSRQPAPSVSLSCCHKYALWFTNLLLHTLFFATIKHYPLHTQSWLQGFWIVKKGWPKAHRNENNYQS